LILRLLILLTLCALPVRAEEVVAGLSQRQISISTNFDGSEILIFGAIKRQQAIDYSTELGVIITVSGPDEALTVRRKEKVGPIWVNVDALGVQSAPTLYAVSTSAPISELVSDETDLLHRISVRSAIFAGMADQGVDGDAFTEALIRIRTESKRYQMNEGAVELTSDTLFNTSVSLPANLVEGNYAVRFLLLRDKQVISQYETVIFVRKVGMERFLHALAYEQPYLYGLLSLFIAIAAGWGASAVFRYVRN
jgi:uncharacterized protein (TIGR02186 family)